MKLEHEEVTHRFDGYYDDADDSINIASKLGKYEAECVYLHERQHQKCFKAKCKCWGLNTDFLCEYHAYRAEFHDIVKRKNKHLANAYIRQLKRDVTKFKADPKFWRDHIKALNKLMHTKAFKAFIKTLGLTSICV